MSNTIGRAKILTAPCIFFKKRYATPVREDFRGGFRGGFSGQGGGKEGRGRRDGTGRAAGQDRAGQGGRERAGQSGGGADRSRASVEAGAETGGGKRTKKTGETRKNGKTGKNWKIGPGSAGKTERRNGEGTPFGGEAPTLPELEAQQQHEHRPVFAEFLAQEAHRLTDAVVDRLGRDVELLGNLAVGLPL